MSTDIALANETPEGVVAVTVKTKDGRDAQALVPAELAERYPSLGQADELADLLNEVFGDDEDTLSITDLPRVKVPDGNTKAFTVGDDVHKTIEGILIVRQNRRNFWEKSMSEGGGNQAPDCYSRDGKRGLGTHREGSAENPSGLCENCPLSQWAENGEQRVPPPCKPQVAALILVEGSAFPWLLTVPRTSVKALNDYVKRTLMAGKTKSPVEVITRISLVQEKNSENLTYNTLRFDIAKDITAGMTPAEKRAYKLAPLALGEQFKTILTTIDTSRDTEAPERQNGTPRTTDDDEGGFRISDDADNVAAEYAGQSAG